MGHFVCSKYEPCLQTRVNIYPWAHPDPWVEAKLVLLTKLWTADLTWVLSGRGGVTGMVIFFTSPSATFCFACSNRWITRGYKLLIITWQLWRATEDPRRCGSPMAPRLLFFSDCFSVIMHAISSFRTRREHKSHQFWCKATEEGKKLPHLKISQEAIVFR